MAVDDLSVLRQGGLLVLQVLEASADQLLVPHAYVLGSRRPAS